MKKWSKNFDKCQGCGTVDRTHLAKGFCWLCDKRIRRGLPAVAEPAPVAPTSSDGLRGWRKCCRCEVMKPYGPGPNGEPSEFPVESRFYASGERRGKGYKSICILCARQYANEYISERRDKYRESNRIAKQKRAAEKRAKIAEEQKKAEVG